MFKLDTKNKPRGRLVREADPDEQCVRVYKNSPEDLMLQIWDGRRYLLVALYPQEARAIADALVETADAIQFGNKPMSNAELVAIVTGKGA